jgi:hypothetical protein
MQGSQLAQSYWVICAEDHTDLENTIGSHRPSESSMNEWGYQQPLTSLFSRLAATNFFKIDIVFFFFFF